MANREIELKEKSNKVQKANIKKPKLINGQENDKKRKE